MLSAFQRVWTSCAGADAETFGSCAFAFDSEIRNCEILPVCGGNRSWIVKSGAGYWVPLLHQSRRSGAPSWSCT